MAEETTNINGIARSRLSHTDYGRGSLGSILTTYIIPNLAFRNGKTFLTTLGNRKSYSPGHPRLVHWGRNTQ